MNQERLEVLLDRFFDEALTPEEHKEFEAALLSSPQARTLFWRRARFNALLRRRGQERACGFPPPLKAFLRGREGFARPVIGHCRGYGRVLTRALLFRFRRRFDLHAGSIPPARPSVYRVDSPVRQRSRPRDFA